MLKRTITGFILACIFIPAIFLGGYFLSTLVILLGIFATHEAITIKEKVPERGANPEYGRYPIYIKITAHVLMQLLIFGIDHFTKYAYSFKNGLLPFYGLDEIFVALSLIILLAYVVCDKRFKLLDAAYIFLMLILISMGLKGLLYLRSINAIKDFSFEFLKLNIYKPGIYILLYVFAITCLCDIFAYFGGMLCYKLLGSEKVHKLNVRISPKKTWEGSITGTIIAVIVGSLIFALLINGKYNINLQWYIYIPLTLLIAISGQFGDLFLSSIKRVYNVKDYSRLLPGHGGILDRIDSLLINCIVTATIMCMFIG